MITPCRTATGPAGTEPQAADMTGRILRITPVNSFAATAANVSVESKAAITTDKFMWIIRLGKDVYRAADQTD
jgi:hypothetical protein